MATVELFGHTWETGDNEPWLKVDGVVCALPGIAHAPPRVANRNRSFVFVNVDGGRGMWVVNPIDPVECLEYIDSNGLNTIKLKSVFKITLPEIQGIKKPLFLEGFLLRNFEIVGGSEIKSRTSRRYRQRS